LEKRVFQLHFSGVPRDDIALRLDIAPSTVTEILSVLPPEVAPLRQLSKDLKKGEMVLQDSLMGVEIMNEFKAFGIEPQHFSSCLQAVLKMSADAVYKPDRVLQGASKLVELENEAGKSYSEVLWDFEVLNEKTRRKKRETNRLRKKNSTLRAQIKENEERAAQTFKAAEEAPKDISRFKKQKIKLRQNGLSFDDIDTVNRLLENIKEVGGDVKRLVSLVETYGSLNSKISELDEKLERVSFDLASLEARKENIELELRQKSDQNSYLQNQIESNLCTLAFQDQEIQNRRALLSRISCEYERVDALRREVIIQTGNILGVDNIEAMVLQADANFDLVFNALKRRMKAYVERR
jgi:hypothetical protein